MRVVPELREHPSAEDQTGSGKTAQDLSARALLNIPHEVDLLDEQPMPRAVESATADEVYNVADTSSVLQSWSEPVTTTKVNGVGVTLLLGLVFQFVRRTDRQPRFVHASSAEIFTENTATPTNKTTPARTAAAVRRIQGALNIKRGCAGREESTRRTQSSTTMSAPAPLTFVTRKITAAVAAIARGDRPELVLGNLDVRRDWRWTPDYVDAMIRAARAEVADDYVIATGGGDRVRGRAMMRPGISDWEHFVRSDSAFEGPASTRQKVGACHPRAPTIGLGPTIALDELVGRMVDHDLAT